MRSAQAWYASPSPRRRSKNGASLICQRYSTRTRNVSALTPSTTGHMARGCSTGALFFAFRTEQPADLLGGGDHLARGLRLAFLGKPGHRSRDADRRDNRAIAIADRSRHALDLTQHLAIVQSKAVGLDFGTSLCQLLKRRDGARGVRGQDGRAEESFQF